MTSLTENIFFGSSKRGSTKLNLVVNNNGKDFATMQSDLLELINWCGQQASTTHSITTSTDNVP